MSQEGWLRPIGVAVLSSSAWGCHVAAGSGRCARHQLLGRRLPPSGSTLVCGRRVRAICGRDRRRAQALAEQHDVPEVYTDYRAMIDSSELDALVVVMPEDLHHPMVMACVEAGLHVLCEKPMAFMADRSGGNAGGRAGAGEAHGAVHQSRAAA